VLFPSNDGIQAIPINQNDGKIIVMRGIFIIFTGLISLLFATSTHAQTGSATITWTASPSANVTGYVVFYGTSSGDYSSGVPVGNVTSVTINGLTNGQTYYFTAVAMNNSGNVSSMSPEISGLVGAISPAAAVLSSALASAAGHFSFTVSGSQSGQYITQGSTDLVNWTSLQTNTAVPFTFVDPNASQYSRRFYRTVYVPNSH
jgi:hypothetical protein